MAKYLGQEIVDVSTTIYKDFTGSDWAMFFLERYGQIDGAHHKTWVLDQIARVLKGSIPIIALAKWDNGYQEYRVNVDVPSQEYLDWVVEMKSGEDGPNTYDYDDGINP